MTTIPVPNYDKKVTFENGDTKDIITTVLEVAQKDAAYLDSLIEKENFTADRDGLKRVHDWVWKNIIYILDPSGEQWIKTANRTIYDRFGDCKSISILIHQIIKRMSLTTNVDLTSFLRFVSYNPTDSDKKHVYVVAVINGKNIPIDPVYSHYKKKNMFGKEKFFFYKEDLPKSVQGVNWSSFFKNATPLQKGVGITLSLGVIYGLIKLFKNKDD